MGPEGEGGAGGERSALGCGFSLSGAALGIYIQISWLYFLKIRKEEKI